MPATIAGSHLGPDTHANRPAANAAGQPIGALYSCTTHSLIYITNGSAWSTYATLGATADLAGKELDYVAITSPVNVTATSEATANTIVTGSSVAYDGSTIVLIEFFAPYATTVAGANMYFILYDSVGTASIGLWSLALGAASLRNPVLLQRRLTPSNASHTYSVRAFTDSGTAVTGAGAGGNAAVMPAFIRITRVSS